MIDKLKKIKNDVHIYKNKSKLYWQPINRMNDYSLFSNLSTDTFYILHNGYL